MTTALAFNTAGAGTITASKSNPKAFAAALLKAGTIIPSDPVKRVFFHLSDREEKTLLVLGGKCSWKAHEIIKGFGPAGKEGKGNVFYAPPDEASKFGKVDCVVVGYKAAMKMRTNLKDILTEGGLLFIRNSPPLLFSKSGNELISLRQAGEGV